MVMTMLGTKPATGVSLAPSQPKKPIVTAIDKVISATVASIPTQERNNNSNPIPMTR